MVSALQDLPFRRRLRSSTLSKRFGPLRNTMDLSPQGFADLLLTHPDFGPNSPTSHLPSVVRSFVADALLVPTGARMGGRKIPEYSKVPRHAARTLR